MMMDGLALPFALIGQKFRILAATNRASRYAVRPAVFENTHLDVNVALGTRYGPGNNMPVTAATPTGHGTGYAPASCT